MKSRGRKASSLSSGILFAQAAKPLAKGVHLTPLPNYHRLTTLDVVSRLRVIPPSCKLFVTFLSLNPLPRFLDALSRFQLAAFISN